MFENYSARNQDFKAIEKVLQIVWHPKMKFVFRDRSKIANTVVVSYDSEFVYLWTKKRLPKYHIRKFPHTLKLKDGWQYAWCAGLWDESVEKVLPSPIKKSNRFQIPIVSGGLLNPFINLQKKRKGQANWPYTTYASFLATIVHEFGHVYWNQHKLWWPSNKKRNLSYLTLAKELFENKVKRKIVHLGFPLYTAFSEVFAFCTEYYASSLFWPGHKKTLDSSNLQRIRGLIEDEKEKDLEKADSVLEPTKNPHDFALVFGKIMLELYPTKWPEILTSSLILKGLN